MFEQLCVFDTNTHTHTHSHGARQSDSALGEISGATAQFEADRQQQKQLQATARQNTIGHQTWQSQHQTPQQLLHQTPQQHQSPQQHQHLQFFSPANGQAHTGAGMAHGGGFGRMFAGSGLGGPFANPFAAGDAFGSFAGMVPDNMPSHANPAVPPSEAGGSLLVLPSGLSSLTYMGIPGSFSSTGVAPARLSQPVANSLKALSLNATDYKGSGNASPDTSTEFEFAIAANGAAGAAHCRAGWQLHAGPGQSTRAPAPMPQQVTLQPSLQRPLPQQPAQQQDITLANVATLQDMFPGVGAAPIRQILSNFNGNLEEAANHLSDCPQPKPTNNWSSTTSVTASPQKSAAPERSRARPDIFLDWSMGEVQYYLLIGYLGTGWAGFQFNANIDTGQGALLKLLYDMDAVASPKPHAMTFTASRTDKGVHAVCLLLQTPMRQMMYGREDEFVARVNSELQKRGAPHKNMHMFGVRMTPRELLDLNNPLDIRNPTCRINSNHLIKLRTYMYVVPSYVLSKSPGSESKEETVVPLMKKFRIKPAELEHANTMLAAYVRRADFRQFTDPKRLQEYLTQDQGGTEREVSRCGVLKIINKNGYEFAFIEITGDRFMYHQIRLMMGLAFLSIQADLTPADSITAVLNGSAVPGKNFTKLPLAPAEPLLLRELNYRDDGGAEVIAAFLAETAQKREEFCQTVVVPHVFEKAPKPVALFVCSLHQTGGYAWNIQNGRVC